MWINSKPCKFLIQGQGQARCNAKLQLMILEQDIWFFIFIGDINKIMVCANRLQFGYHNYCAVLYVVILRH